MRGDLTSAVLPAPRGVFVSAVLPPVLDGVFDVVDLVGVLAFADFLGVFVLVDFSVLELKDFALRGVLTSTAAVLRGVLAVGGCIVFSSGTFSVASVVRLRFKLLIGVATVTVLADLTADLEFAASFLAGEILGVTDVLVEATVLLLLLLPEREIIGDDFALLVSILFEDFGVVLGTFLDVVGLGDLATALGVTAFALADDLGMAAIVSFLVVTISLAGVETAAFFPFGVVRSLLDAAVSFSTISFTFLVDLAGDATTFLVFSIVLGVLKPNGVLALAFAGAAFAPLGVAAGATLVFLVDITGVLGALDLAGVFDLDTGVVFLGTTGVFAVATGVEGLGVLDFVTGEVLTAGVLGAFTAGVLDSLTATGCGLREEALGVFAFLRAGLSDTACWREDLESTLLRLFTDRDLVETDLAISSFSMISTQRICTRDLVFCSLSFGFASRLAAVGVLLAVGLILYVAVLVRVLLLTVVTEVEMESLATLPLATPRGVDLGEAAEEAGNIAFLGDALAPRLALPTSACSMFNSRLKDFRTVGLVELVFPDFLEPSASTGVTLLELDVGRMFSWPGGGGGVELPSLSPPVCPGLSSDDEISLHCTMSLGFADAPLE